MKKHLYCLLIILVFSWTNSKACSTEEVESIQKSREELKELARGRLSKITKDSRGVINIPPAPESERISQADLDKKLLVCANLGNSFAEYLMGWDSKVLAQTQEKANESLTKFAQENRIRIDPVTQAQMEGLKQAVFSSYQVALVWYSKSAKSEFAFAMDELAQLYRDGKGTEKSIFLAVAWFDRAARTYFSKWGALAKPTITQLLEEMTKIAPNHPLTLRLSEDLYSSNQFDKNPWDVVSVSPMPTATPNTIEPTNKKDFTLPNIQTLNAHALVIGNGAYAGGARLINPINDSKLIAQKLRNMGFNVTELTNLNRSTMVTALSQFNRKAINADLTLLFYAGHGVQISGTNYLLPIDINLSDLDQVPLFGVPINAVLDQYLPGKIKLVFLDACRENPLIASNTRGFSRGLAPMNVAKGTLISYSTKDGQVALDGDGQKNSPFTTALLQHLDDPQDIAVILRKVREKVMASTNGKQEPWEYGSLTGGELVLSQIRKK
jgi:hypothetical protein